MKYCNTKLKCTNISEEKEDKQVSIYREMQYNMFDLKEQMNPI